jgi:ribosomal protein S17E
MEKEQVVIIPTEESDKDITPSFGKFQTAEELLKAYNSLEGEFTKRSQKLREYEKVTTPKTDWESKVNLLLDKYPIAEKYTDDLAKEIGNNKNLLQDDNCLEKALISVLSQKVKSKADMASDEEVVSMVMGKDDNREKVIADYLTQIRTKSLPKTFPKTGGAIPAISTKPISLGEAGKLAQKYLEEK